MSLSHPAYTDSQDCVEDAVYSLFLHSVDLQSEVVSKWSRSHTFQRVGMRVAVNAILYKLMIDSCCCIVRGMHIQDFQGSS